MAPLCDIQVQVQVEAITDNNNSLDLVILLNVGLSVGIILRINHTVQSLSDYYDQPLVDAGGSDIDVPPSDRVL